MSEASETRKCEQCEKRKKVSSFISKTGKELPWCGTCRYIFVHGKPPPKKVRRTQSKLPSQKWPSSVTGYAGGWSSYGSGFKRHH